MWHSCALDEAGCVDLHQILAVFSAPITEEHAWALVHQTVEILDTILEDDQSEFYRIQTARDIIMNIDGSVHFNTFYLNRNNRNILKSESLAIADLGAAIYDALDYSLETDEQRTISGSLENLIEKMTSADEDDDDMNEDDEGIDDDGMVKLSGQCSMVLDLCRYHLASKSEAESHYRAVCRALVAEALEISTFMEKMKTNNEADDQLNNLEMGDWANIWTDVMGELRHGIKLKKVSCSKTPTEFELTPYEMLMADIRKKTAKLQPARIPPKVKTDAKDIILDFIRSRPPLKPVSQRKLGPKVDDSTPMEKLMQEIRSTDSTKCLKKTTFPVLRPRPSALSVKKTINPDESFFNDILNFDDSEELRSPSPKPESKSIPNSETTPSKCDNFNTRTVKPLRKPLSIRSPSSRSNNDFDRLETSVKLSLFEFGHIRVQETRAELAMMEMEEEDGGGASLSELEMGRVCFSCRAVRFRMLNWAYNCHFCKKNVCSSCYVKLKLPVEKLKEVTVASLISQLSPANESKARDGAGDKSSVDPGFIRDSLNRMSLRSSKPKAQDVRKTSSPDCVTPLPRSSGVSAYRPRMLRSSTTLSAADGRGGVLTSAGAGESQGSAATVCLKCKQSLVNIIRSMSNKCRQSSTIIPGIKM